MYFQLQRNILATSPRVTRFRIDWTDQKTDAEITNEDDENQVPMFNTESESNQMAIEMNGDSLSLKLGGSDSLMGPPSNKQELASEKVLYGATSTDSNSMPLSVNGLNGRTHDEDMQM